MTVLHKTTATYTIGLPTTQTVSFGAKTLKGHGGSDLSYTGAAVLSITAGNTGSIWMIDTRNQLVPAFSGVGSLAYGTAAPAYSGPYTLTVTDGSFTSTVTINILANTAHTRSHPDGFGPGGTFVNVDTTTSFQLRTLLGSASFIVRGDTVVCRTCDLNLAGADYRIRPPSGFYTGSGYVKIQSEVPLGFRMGSMKLDSAVSGAGAVFVQFDAVSFYGNNPASTETIRMLDIAGTGVLTDIKVTNCRLETSPSSVLLCSGMRIVGNAIYDNNILFNLYDGMSGSALTDSVTITNNELSYVYNDGVKGVFSNVVYKDNYQHNKQYHSGAHGDFFQNLGSSMPASETLGDFLQNIHIRGAGTTSVGDGQGIFCDDQAAGFTLNGINCKNNIIINTFANGIYFNQAVNPNVQRNLVLQDIYGAPISADGTPPLVYYNPTITLINHTGSGGSGGTVTDNVAAAISTSGQTGPITTTPANLTIPGATSPGSVAGVLAAYQAAFANPVFGSLTKAQVIAGWSAKLNGTLLNVDGTYKGPLFPNGTWNDGSVYVP